MADETFAMRICLQNVYKNSNGGAARHRGHAALLACGVAATDTESSWNLSDGRFNSTYGHSLVRNSDCVPITDVKLLVVESVHSEMVG